MIMKKHISRSFASLICHMGALSFLTAPVSARVGDITASALMEAAPSTGTETKVQSAARPFGLDIVGPVYQAGSDESSKDFLVNTLPQMEKLLDDKLGESLSLKDAKAYSLDPTKLLLSTDSVVRVYFVGEGAGYLNSLGFNVLEKPATKETPLLTETAQLIFPNASSEVSSLGSTKNPQRTEKSPLLPGDFAELGKFASGSILDFFLIANGAAGGKTTFVAPPERNEDGLQHLVAFAMPDSPYLLLGFEDLTGGGDRDFNDVLFAVDIGAANVKNLISAPEPGFAAVLLGCLFFGLTGRRRSPAPAMV